MRISLIFFCLLFSLSLLGQSCVGEWITIDDNTQKKKSIVELYKKNGKLYGKIIYLFPEMGRENDPVCSECSGALKNKLVMGLGIVNGLTWDGSQWRNGTIVDPENGEEYAVKIWLDPENGNSMNVRGYIGIFFRTQNWIRQVN